jgi:DNA-binding transcriptional regulator YiaG
MNTSYERRPLSAAEERQILASIMTYEPLQRFTRMSPLDRLRGRQDAGLSYEELGRIIGASPEDVARWESADRPDDASKLYRRFCNCVRQDSVPKPERIVPSLSQHRPTNPPKDEPEVVLS